MSDESILVSDYFEQVFEPKRLRNASQATARKYELAVRRLREFLGRDAILTDLDDEIIQGIGTWLVRFGRSRDRARAMWQCLRAIAKHARDSGRQVGSIRRRCYQIEFDGHNVPTRRPRRLDHEMKRPETPKRVVTAAAMFGQGKRMPAIAEELGVHLSTVRRWRREYPEMWQAGMHKAKQRQR